MENYLVVLILSAFVLLGAFYVHTVNQNIVQIKDELLHHGNEISKKLTEVKVELDTTEKEVKQVKGELDTTKEQMNILRAEMIKKDNAHKKEISQIREDLHALPGELNKIKTEISAHRPGFYATLSPHTDLGHIQTIKFDQKITDVKNNYNTNTGVFTVPKDGLYHISCTMFSKSGLLHAEIMKNDQVIGRNFGISSYVSAAIDVVMSCKQGDSVFVRHMTGQSSQNIHGSGYSAFSGFLIH